MATVAATHGRTGGAVDPGVALGPAQRVDLGGGAVLEYHERGAGETLVFVHGVLVNAAVWRDVVPPLAAGHRCVSLELPLGAHRVPMGADVDMTPPGVARLIAGFLAELDLHDVTIVANDAGGAVTQLLLTRHPQRIARAVLTPCDTFSGFPPGLLAPLRRLSFVPGALPLILRMNRLPLSARMFYGSVAHRRIEPGVLDGYVRPLIEDAGVRRDLGRFFQGVDPAQTLRAAHRLPDVRIPVLLVWGRHDRWFPLRNARRLAALLPDARLEVLERARTFLPEDQPERLANLIAGFVSETAR